MKVIKVDWIDSSSQGGWQSQKSAQENAGATLRCTTIGFLVDEQKDRLTVAASTEHFSGSVCDAITIPKCSITRRKYIKP